MLKRDTNTSCAYAEAQRFSSTEKYVKYTSNQWNTTDILPCAPQKLRADRAEESMVKRPSRLLWNSPEKSGQQSSSSLCLLVSILHTPHKTYVKLFPCKS